jgi:site-specific DNA recombinase
MDRTCGDDSCTTSDEFVRILDFRHFERHMMFSQSDRKTYKKAVSDGVNVSVVLDVVSRNTY